MKFVVERGEETPDWRVSALVFAVGDVRCERKQGKRQREGGACLLCTPIGSTYGKTGRDLIPFDASDLSDDGWWVLLLQHI